MIVYILFDAYIMCYLYMVLARSLDMTHLWCLGLDLDPAGDAFVEAPVTGNYGWGPVEQVVEPEDGVPTPSVWEQFTFGILNGYVVSREIDCYVQTCYSNFEILLDFSPALLDSFYIIHIASAIFSYASAN